MSYVVHNFVDGDIIQATPMNEMDAQIKTNETNIGLKVPKTDIVNNLTTNDSTKVLSAAQGKALKDSIDNINQSTLRDVPFAIAVSDWSSVTGGFSATFNTAYVTTASKEILIYDNSLASYAKAHINAAKKSGGGGITFTTATKPTGTITGNAYVFDNDDHKIPTLIESTVTPIANGGTGQSSLAGAQQALGITALSNQVTNLGSTSSTILGSVILKKRGYARSLVATEGLISGITNQTIPQADRPDNFITTACSIVSSDKTTFIGVGIVKIDTDGNITIKLNGSDAASSYRCAFSANWIL